MKQELDLILSPHDASTEEVYIRQIAQTLGITPKQITYTKIIRRSIDARKRDIKVAIRVLAYWDEQPKDEPKKVFEYPSVAGKPAVHIIGAGPAGLFAALRLIELGIKPIILERGKDVRARRYDIAAINREQKVNPDSNYSFGEGGAGTYSDGKLYTRSKKRGNVQKVLEVLHFHGASEEILIDAHPHIGTNKLPLIIEAIRKNILDAGGEIHFNTRVDNFIVKDNKISAVVTPNETISVEKIILASGHSARNIFEALHASNIFIEAKPFAMGVRVEHPQSLIDQMQYHCTVRSEYLPAAAYNLVKQVNGRGVYSFCMCPGGFIVPAATSDDEIVVNGMSPASRNSKYANSGMVVEIRLEDIPQLAKFGALAGLKFQQFVENMAKKHGGGGQIAPAQRLMDFVRGRKSYDLPEVSYFPGIASSEMHHWLPLHIGKRLQAGFAEFDKSMQGYLTNEAVILGVESRTSSPVRIPRDRNTFRHLQIENLFPCGEGAGYAGGIVSAAIDGERTAEAICGIFSNTENEE
ncbi:MAG TPA: FAD-binding protein [Bacteroidales bacterium]|nr:FAD-binding protein [Bacteroidales bacterium]